MSVYANTMLWKTSFILNIKMQIFKKIFLIYLVLFIWLRQVLVMACERLVEACGF